MRAPAAAAAVVATHFLDETLEADRVLTLRDGRIVFSGTPAEYREASRMSAIRCCLRRTVACWRARGCSPRASSSTRC